MRYFLVLTALMFVSCSKPAEMSGAVAEAPKVEEAAKVEKVVNGARCSEWDASHNAAELTIAEIKSQISWSEGQSRKNLRADLRYAKEQLLIIQRAVVECDN